MNSDYRLTAHKTAEEVSMILLTVKLILLSDLKVKEVCAKMVLKNLAGEQELGRKNLLTPYIKIVKGI